ncbi:MAG: hypothetical protein MI810_22465 [Flavobacteriales bacterium]|nr:hypothetical protein [Flavobacteriales bacterium]
MMQKRSIVLFCLAAVLLSVSCKKNRFKRNEFLEQMYDYKITPEIQQARQSFEVFNNDWNSYTASLSSDKLESSKASLMQALKDIEYIRFYNLGDIAKIYIYNTFSKTSPNTEGLWEYYETTNTFAQNDIASLPNTQRGIYLAEYLLFGPYAPDSVGTEKYNLLITAVSADALDNLNSLETAWEVYEKNFLKMTDDGVDGSYNILNNRIIHSIEDVVAKWLNPVLDSNDPTVAPGFYSKTYLDNVKIQVQQIYDVYLGKGTSDFNSIHTSLRKKNKKLADNMQNDFDELISYQNQLTMPIEHYVAEDISPIEEYKSMLKDLLVKFKLDVATELDIIITIGDTDGD